MNKLLIGTVLLCFSIGAIAQEEEQEVKIEIESGGVEVGLAGESTRAIAAFPDKSVWYFEPSAGDDAVVYCWVGENEEPRCKTVDIED